VETLAASGPTPLRLAMRRSDRRRRPTTGIVWSAQSARSPHQALRNEVRALRGDLDERNQRVRVLEAQLLEANQRRQDTCKRVDELIAQLDQLDAQLENAEPTE
jgi:uncharacterized coiled-coil DUF342 family protein